jgi:hypothetical protein
MSEILKAELQIVGKDGTGPAFAGVIKHAEQLRSALGRLGNMNLGDAQLKAASAELRQQTGLLRTQRLAAQELTRSYMAGNAALAERTGMLARMQRRMEGFTSGMGMYGWMAGGYAAGRTMKASAIDAADFAHQRAMLATTTGMTAGEVQRAVDQAVAMRVPLMSATDNLKTIGELRMVFGSTEEAIRNANAVQRAAATMKAVNPNKDASAESYDLARALELKGVSMDPAHFMRLTDRMVQAINASRGKITGEGFFEFTQYARGAARYLSDDFYTRVAPSLIQEMRPTSAGRAIASLYQQVIGGKMSNRAAQEWVKLGLIDPSKVIYTKTGSVKGVQPGGFVDAAGFMSDPYAWIQKHLGPALAKHGFTDESKVGEELAHLFSNMYASQMAGILLQQKQRIEKDWGLNEQAPGSSALDKLREQDPKAALTDLGAGINSLLAALGSPLAGQAAHVMNMLADGARYMGTAFAGLAKRDPMAAEGLTIGAGLGLGYVGLKGMQAMFGMFTGSTALKGSAIALDQSAAALTAAAGKLAATGKGSVPAVGGAPAVLGGWSSAIPGVSTALALWSIMEDARQKADTLPTVTWSQWASSKFGSSANSEYMRPGFQTSMREFMETYGPLDAPPALRRGGGIGSDYVNSLHDGGAKSELSGSAEITLTHKVEPTPDFWVRIETMISNSLNGLRINGAPGVGTAGSTGSAMPEAMPAGGP